MATYIWDHIHLRSSDPEATALWLEHMLGAQVIRSMQQGKPRIDLKRENRLSNFNIHYYWPH